MRMFQAKCENRPGESQAPYRATDVRVNWVTKSGVLVFMSERLCISMR